MVSGAYKTEFGESDEISQCMKKVNVSHFRCEHILFMKSVQLFSFRGQLGYSTGMLPGRDAGLPVTPIL